MSHITSIEADSADQQIVSLPALGRAAAACGMELRLGQTTHRNWASDHGGKLYGDAPLPAGMTEADVGKCEHAICVPGAERARGTGGYEIGVVASRKFPDTFSLAYDSYGGLLERHAGPALGQLIQRYRAEVVKETAEALGDAVTETVLPDGSIVIEADTTMRTGLGA